MPGDDLSQLCFSAHTHTHTPQDKWTKENKTRDRLVSLLQSCRVSMGSVVEKEQPHFDGSEEVALFQMHSINTRISL